MRVDEVESDGGRVGGGGGLGWDGRISENKLVRKRKGSFAFPQIIVRMTTGSSGVAGKQGLEAGGSGKEMDQSGSGHQSRIDDL